MWIYFAVPKQSVNPRGFHPFPPSTTVGVLVHPRVKITVQNTSILFVQFKYGNKGPWYLNYKTLTSWMRVFLGKSHFLDYLWNPARSSRAGHMLDVAIDYCQPLLYTRHTNSSILRSILCWHYCLPSYINSWAHPMNIPFMWIELKNIYDFCFTLLHQAGK